MKKLSVITFLIMMFAWVPLMVMGANVQTIRNGEWSDTGIWSTGEVPGSNDDVLIRHHVTRRSAMLINQSGRLTVDPEGTLKVIGNLENQGNVIIHDSLTIRGYLSAGTGVLENYGTVVCNGNFQVESMAAVSNFGSMRIDGNVTNNWKIWTTGYMYVKGSFDNNVYICSPPGSQGLFEVCGTLTHHSGATAEGTLLLCLRCNGRYIAEPGHIGDFVLQCSPFSVTLSEFNAAPVNDDAVNLTWTSLTEQNSAWFVIERSSPSEGTECRLGKCGSVGEFAEIGKVAAAGNSESARNYQFVDDEPVAGQNYYRLKMVDKNGEAAYSSIVEAYVVNGNVNLIAYPNPNHSVLHIEAKGAAGKAAVLSLYSVDGRLVWEHKLDMSQAPFHYDMQTCDFASGVYILKLAQGNRKEVKKLIFEK